MFQSGKSDVLVDLCTQRDYLASGGVQRIANADVALLNLKRLMIWARWTKAAILSTVDTRRREEVLGLDGAPCVAGTWGQQKINYTLMPDRAVVESDNRLCVPLDILARFQQAILAKQHRDPWTNPKLDRLLTEMPARRFVVFGVALESSIRPLVLGLLLRGRRVAVISDACGYWNDSEADFCLRQLDAKGCSVLTTAAFLQESRSGKTAWASGRRGRRSVA